MLAKGERRRNGEDRALKKTKGIELIGLDDWLARGSEGLGGVHFRWLQSF